MNNYLNNDEHNEATDEYMNDDIEVRPADKIQKERLIEDVRSDFEKEIEEATYWSLQEFEQQEEINKQYEVSIINEHIAETLARKKIFDELLLTMNKVIIYDNNIKEIYEIIEPIITSYCSQHIQTYEVDTFTYERIFKILGTIRTNKFSIETLKKMIVPI